MTKKTPLERLDESIEEWAEAYADLHSYGGELCDAAIAYRYYAEARIKELVDALHEVKEREATEIVRANVAEAKLKAWEDAPMVEVSGQSLVDYTGDYALDGTYHLKPKEADDAQGN